MNRLLVPFTAGVNVAPVLDALGAAETHGWHVDTSQVDSADQEAYWRLLRACWATSSSDGTDLMVVEHDIVIHAAVFTGFALCTSPVCVFGYWLGASYGYGLGCVRFRNTLIASQPDALDRVGEIVDDGLPFRRHWKRLDTRMWRVLGIPCYHEPPVRHLHVYPIAEPGI